MNSTAADKGEGPVSEEQTLYDYLSPQIDGLLNFVYSKGSVVDPGDEDIATLRNLAFQLSEGGTTIGEVVHLQEESYIQDAEKKGKGTLTRIANQVRGAGNIITLEEDGLSETTLGNIAKARLADQISTLEPDYGDVSEPTLFALAELYQDLARLAQEAETVLAAPASGAFKKRLGKALVGIFGRDDPHLRGREAVGEDVTPKLDEETGRARIREFTRILSLITRSPTEAISSTEAWHELIYGPDQEDGVKDLRPLPERLVAIEAINLATRFVAQGEADKYAEEEAGGLSSKARRATIRAQRRGPVAHPARGVRDSQPGRKKSRPQGEQEREEVPKRGEEVNLHNLETRTIDGFPVTLRWMNDGRSQNSGKVTIVRYQGQDVIVINGLIPDLKSISDESRDEFKNVVSKDGLNPYDTIKNNVAKRFASGINPSSDPSRYLEGVYGELDEYDGFEIWHTTGRARNAARGYYIFTNLGEVVSSKEDIPEDFSKDTKVMVVVAETSKKMQTRTLTRLTKLSHSELRSRGVGAK